MPSGEGGATLRGQMKFSCDRCNAQYSIAPEKVGAKAFRVVCKKCGHDIRVAAGAAAQLGQASGPSETTGRVAAPEPENTVGHELEEELGAAFASAFTVADGQPSEGTRPAGAADGKAAPGAKSGSGTQAAGSAAVWYVAIDNAQVGPLSQQQLGERWRRREIGPDTLCWRSGLKSWMRISEIEELRGLRAGMESEGAAATDEPAPKAKAAASSVSAERPLVGSASATSTSQGASTKTTSAPKAEKSASTKATDPVAAGASAASKTESAKEQASEKKDTVAAGKAANADWKPAAGTALSSLVEKEVQQAKERPRSEPQLEEAPAPESTGIRVLLRDLPEPPPPESSRFIPREEPKRPAGRASAKSAEGKAEGLPKRALWGALALLVVLVGVGVVLFRDLPPFGASAHETTGATPAQAAEGAETPAKGAEEAPKPSEGEAVAAAAGGAEGAKAAESAEEGEAEAGEGEAEEKGTEVAEAPADAAADAPAEARAEAPAAEAPKAEARPASTRRATNRTRQAQTTRQRQQAPARNRQAQSQIPRPPAPKGDDLLAAGNRSSIDELFEKELSQPTPAKGGAGAPPPAAYIPPPPGSGNTKPRSLSEGDITAVVASHRSAIRGCVNRYKEQGGPSSATITMRWVIEPSGRTSSIETSKGKEHAPLANCLSGLIRGWRFPAYDGPTMKPVDFPFSY